MLISTKPDSKGKEAILYRSRQLTEFKWTPLKDVPVYDKIIGKTKLCAGEKQSGMVYSSTEPIDKFITENVSFETFLSVIANPDSALYNKDLNGHSNSWAYFGIVCNGFVRYALDIRRRYNTRHWPDIAGMRKIADEECYTAEQIELCDILYAYGKGRNHVALITDILRDEKGKIHQVEVSEATPPISKRAQYDVEEFYENYKLFALWRYDFADSVPMPDERDDECLKNGVPPLGVISVDYGNKSNYRTDEDVVISVFADGENEIEIRRGDELIEKVVISGKGNISRRLDGGYYTVTHKNTGEYAEFCVTSPLIKHSVNDGEITINIDSGDSKSKILYMDFRGKRANERVNENKKDAFNKEVKFYCDNFAALTKVEELSDEEKKTGIIIREIPEGAENYKIYFENKYGIWTHSIIRIKGDEKREI